MELNPSVGAVAIVGMAGRFPGAASLEEFWGNLRDGVDAVRDFSDEELRALGVPEEVLADPGYVKAAAQPADVDRFDAGFFGFSPREAEILDPQQRLFLEACWQALEDAGYDPEGAGGRMVGVYGGATISTYLLFNLMPNAALRQALDPLQLLVGNAPDSLATRVSYKLNLKGPSTTVQSACSTSLVATHLACQSLLAGESDLALAGGVSINVSLLAGYERKEGSVFSSSGRCRAFDAGAEGILFGGGVGVVVLKRLEDALAEGDTIRAVIRGSAVNNDGAVKVGYTAPSVEGQAKVISEALGAAGVPAESLSYLEAHGTGTRLGDPIEIQALAKAFRAETDRRGFLPLGSVKTNVGHLDTAAGVAGLIKTVLALEHRQIPPSLHFATANPEIDFAGSPVYVNTRLLDWDPAPGAPRRAGVSSFGFGGTNAHLILEEAPARPAAPPSPGWQTLPLAAKSETALARLAENLADHLERHPELDLADVAHTLQVGRSAFAYRRVVLARDRAEAVDALRKGQAQAGERGALAGRWLAGETVDWSAVQGGQARRRVPLPTYPFERERYWIDAPGIHLPGKPAPAAPRPLHPRPGLFTPYAEARDPREQGVVEIWQEILGVAPVGIHDNFFELGGHSLLATQVLSRVREVFCVDFPLQHLFSFPTAAELAEAVGYLQQEQNGDAILAPPHPPTPIERSSRQGDLPLSFAQQRLWFIDQHEPDRSLYIVPIALQVKGNLSIAVLARALSEVVRRHEVLRSVFTGVGERARQVVLPPDALAVPLVDMAGLPSALREPAARSWILEEARRPFDLAKGPLVRARVWRWSEGEHVLLLAFHHIVCDGWSLGVLLQEVKALYAAFSAGRASPLAKLPVQYADFAIWQRGWLSGHNLEEQIAPWRERLVGAPPLELMADRPRPRLASSRAGIERARLPLAAALQALARRAGATLFMALLAGFEALLGRHTGQDDFLVGTPIANRSRPELAGLIGFFVNPLALRADLAGDPSFGVLLERARDTALWAYAHQDAPFDKLVEALAPERDRGRAPLFQAILVLEALPADGIELPGLATELLDLERAGSEVDLELAVVEREEDLELKLAYRTDLVTPVRARRMVGHLAALLAGAVAEPERRPSELPMLSPGERQQLLGEWPWGAAGVEPAGLLHQRFADHAARAPEAPALLWEGGELSYGELERRANQLARRLRRMGVGPEVVVALLLPRDGSFVTSILAVWKAGGAYLALDPETPVERLRYLLADSGAAVLIAGEAGAAAGLIEPGKGPAPLWLDEEGPRLAELPGHRIDAGAGLDSLAYVLYTSGSTGRPKGVLVPHRGLANVLGHAAAALAVSGEGDRVLHNSSFSFDASVLETFLALATGAALCLSNRRQRASGGELADWMRQARVSTAILTPQVLEQLLEPGAEGFGRLPSLPALKSATVGGERCPPELAALWSGAVRLFNCYGPTEATIYATAEPLGPGLASEGGSLEGPAIGRPLPGMRAYLADPRLELVPVGSAGEIHLGGAGVVRGYLGRPDLTAERFVPDPWGAPPGGRLYRTGDLALHLPDGRLRFAGRADQQIKLRGVRIEPEEIEAVLRRHPALEGAVVVAMPDPPRLVALIVPRDGQAGIGLPAQLRSYLVQELPPAMVPAEIVAISELPRTRTGKLDRRAASALASRPPAAEAAGTLTPTEELLAGIWAEVLGSADIRAEDNFFTLGGHSLLATQTLSRIREIFAVELSVRIFFENPTLAELAAKLAEARYGTEPLAALSPAGTPRPAAPPLSFAQERLWFLDQLTPGLAAYNMPIALELHGTLHLAALAGAFQALLARHESLRTHFADDGGRPVQVIAPAAEIALPFVLIDLRALPPGVRGGEAARWLEVEAMRPFDLGSGPLIRIHLLRMGEAEHRLLVNLHHIVSDGWSLGVLTAELGALLCGETLPPLPLQYADFALWQRRWLTGKVLERQLKHWRGQLAGLPVLELPTDRRRPAEQSYRGGALEVALPAELARALAELARGPGGATLFMVLLAGFSALLARYSGQEDVALGTVVANRNRREIEGLLGIFVNTLVLRADLSERVSFAGLVARLREVTLGAYGHQDLPFEKLVEELRPDRDTRHAPLVQVAFVLQNMPREHLALPGLDAAVLPLPRTTAKLDLTLTLVEADGRFSGDFEYNADLFDRVTVERMARHFERLLAAAVAAPGVPLGELALLDPTERRQLVVEWSRTGTAEGLATVHARFAQRAAEGTDRPAVLSGDSALTYGELAHRAELLAGRLRALGVGPEDRVGLCLERGAGMVEAVLAVLLAGGTYVPLDPAFPDERLSLMLEDATPRVVLADPRHRARLGGGAWERRRPAGSNSGLGGLEVLLPPEKETEKEPAGRRRSQEMEAAAYVLFTSGSTGRPKGVVVEHRSLAAFLLAMEELDVLEPGRTLLAVTTLGFDIAGLELFLPLVTGGTVAIATRDEAADGTALARWVAEHRIGSLQATPATWPLLLDAGFQAADGFQALSGGEALPAELAARLMAAGARLTNLYGPTETTIWSTALSVAPRHLDGATVPLGRPIARTGIYVLDPVFEPTPVGVPGELMIGGAGVARGYLGLPERTAERFVPDPFGALGGRLYRTGDRARWRIGGELEFLGRLDHQVKLRGFRIELGEIEASLAAHPGVREAVVVLRHDPPGEPRPMAYWSPAAGVSTETAELRRVCQERLPAYMVPSAFVRLERLPRLPNGKLDRRALPVPAAAAESAYVAPESPLEAAVAKIWAEVLGVKPVGMEDDFFADLGGHSLLATRVIAQLRERLGVDLPLRSLFAASTARSWAAQVAQAVAVEGGAPVRRSDPTLPLPLSFAQERLWFLDQLTPGLAAYNMPIAVELHGALDPARLAGAFQALLVRHEALRTHFANEGGRPVQVITTAAERALPFAVVDLRALPAGVRSDEAARQMEAEAGRPFDLGRGPLMRIHLLWMDEAEYRLLVNLHHIVCDGWSLGVLTDELGALLRGETLLPLPLQYADFALWQRRWLSGKLLERQLEHWRGQLAGLPVLELPTDRRRPVEQTYRGGALDIALPAELAAALARLARESRGVTLFMVLVAGFSALLARYSGQEDVVLGTVVANRTHREIEGLIGIFVNTLVLRADLSGGIGFAGLVARIREVTLGAYGHQDLPFEKLVEELRPDRDTSHAPLVQAAFLLQNTPLGPLSLPGLKAAGVPLERRSAKLDLTLSLAEADGRLRGDFEYNADLFDRGTVERMARHFERLLAAAVEAPGVPLAELPLLDPAERRQLVVEWSRTGTAEGLASVPARFARQAAEGPDRPAVVSADAVLTYGGLAHRTELLAGCLCALGVGPEERVGLCLERGAGMVEAVLAVLMAGGAYVPLDPALPDERLTRMLEDAAPRVVLADPRHRARLGGDTRERRRPAGSNSGLRGLEVLLPPEKETEKEPAGRRRSQEVETAAYVLFTSGSTGRPKGVIVELRSLAAFLLAMEELEILEPGRTLLAVTTLGFDIAGLELFLPLVTGGTVAVATRDEAADGAALARLVAEHRIGSLQATPATWPLLLDAGFQAADGFQALSGGEALPAELAARLLAAGARLTNLYGPTETTIWSAALHVTPRHLEGATIPLGRPIARTGIYILDQAFEPTPVGVPGELAIGGAGVARGYLGLPERTAERFVPDPFGTSGGRLYRTGDRARWRSGGELEFLGRLDHQVKLRGFRIELGEIEATLAAHPGVREAAVVLRHDLPAEPRLVAYWSPAGGASLEMAELRRVCQERLPAYMVPAAFVHLDLLPRLPNGKLDRRSLPAPEAERAADFAAPESPLEVAVAEIWAEVLGGGPVGMEDDFFADLGGHSLLAARMIARLRERLGVDLPLRSLFAAPTARAWAARVAEAVAAEGHPLVRRSDPTLPLPLSFAQERLWFLEQLTPELAAYNLPLAVGLTGRLDAAALSTAIATVLERHEALRTRFTVHAGQPVQEVLPVEAARTFVLPRIDLAALPLPAAQAEAARLTRAEAGRAFDLGQDPLLRALLLHLHAEQHRLLLTVHHIASDAWSMGVLHGELAALYGGEALPALPVQYGDYVLWQRRQLTAEVLAGELAWWRRELAGLPALALPADHPRPRVLRYRGGDVFATLPAEAAAALRHQQRRAGATLFMALLAGFSTLLARLSGQDDFAVGTVVANRPRSELEGLIGFFVNTLALRAAPAGRASFAEHLARVREVALAAFAHQDLPFARLVEELRPVRDTGQTPLVQALLVLQNAPRPPVGARGLAMAPEPIERGVALFDLTLHAIEEEGGIACRFEYSADLFDKPTVQRLAERWQRLLTAATAEPDLPLAELPWLTPIEVQETIHEWNGAPLPPLSVARVHELFEHQAARIPEAVAVVDRSRRLTYGELDHAANRLAQDLVARGVGPEVTVGLCLERSAELVIGMLGILKAGGAYVPLDPDYPSERLALLRADSGLGLVVSDPTTAERLEIPTGEVVTLPAREAPPGEAPASEDGAQLPAPARVSERQRVCLPPFSGGEHRPEPSAPSSEAGLAYLIYTSGSTGAPKGVGISHANVVAFLTACAHLYPAAWLTGVLAATSIAFDMSVFEILGTLAWGGTLVLARNLFDETAWDGAWPIRLINTVPSALDKLLESRPLPSTVEAVNLGGEPVPGPLAQKLRQHGIPVINLYAPSETTTYSTYAFAEGDGEAPPIGRPFPGTRVYVLDGELAPVPPGVEGQICIGGSGVTRGYLGRPDLTAERYIPDPHGVGQRLYRTGDRGRHRPNGELECLGRLDQQIKLRGFRIEPGEVEAVLAATPGVHEAVVMLREDMPGDRRLVAYVTLQEAPLNPTTELRRRCQEILPPHMVPAALVVLESFPHLPNGKLDRRGLPAPGAARPETGERFVAPASALEKTVAAAWREVLGIERVGLDDNFFDLGGHSLLAVTLQGQLEQRLERKFALVDLFHHPTVESFARFVARPAEAAAVPLQALETRASQRQAALAARRPFRSPASEGVTRPAAGMLRETSPEALFPR